MKKYLLVGLIVALCFLGAACSANNENTHDAAEAPPIPAHTPEQADFSQSEETTSLDNFAAEPGQNPNQMYYAYFLNNFEIMEYESIYGQWQLWGHRTVNEVRLTKQVYIHQIEGFDYPVLVLAEFVLDDNGTTLSSAEGFLNAYLVKDNEITDDLDKAEFDAIFGTASESGGDGWSGRHENETLHSLKVNGEELFFFDFSDDVRTDGSMETVLDWLKESDYIS
jgi:hypothetical protein